MIPSTDMSGAILREKDTGSESRLNFATAHPEAANTAYILVGEKFARVLLAPQLRDFLEATRAIPNAILQVSHNIAHAEKHTIHVTSLVGTLPIFQPQDLSPGKSLEFKTPGGTLYSLQHERGRSMTE